MMLKRWFFALFCVLFFVSPGMADDPVLLRVLSYNTHHGEGMDGKLDLPRIASVIRSVTPDWVALQEIDVNTIRCGKVNQSAQYAELTGLKHFFAPAIDFEGGFYGILSLSRLKVLKEQYHAMPFSPGHERRMVIEQHAEIPQGNEKSATIRFFATHLDHTADHTDRVAAAKVINEIALQDPNIPSLLAGDLNARPGSPAMVEFDKAWKAAGEEMEYFSFPADKPNIKIDYVLYRPADRWRVVRVEVLDEKVASDHRPVLAIMELLPGPEK
ncbi:MAG: endonuclease/exonuclease/phosphatase family protein [bacterium]